MTWYVFALDVINKIGLLLCHSHIELRLGWGWGWDEVESKLSWNRVEVDCFGVEIS